MIDRALRKKEFIKLFDSMTGAHSRPELWRDMIPLFALCSKGRDTGQSAM